MNNIIIPYYGGQIVLREEGDITLQDGRTVHVKKAIKITSGSITSVLDFPAFTALVEAYYTQSRVRDFLEASGVSLKKGLLG